MTKQIVAFSPNVAVIGKKEVSSETGGWLSVKQNIDSSMGERDRVGRQAAQVLFGGPKSGSAASVQQYLKRYSRILTNEQLWLVYQRTPDVRACVDAIVRRVATWDWMVEPTLPPSDPNYQRALEVAENAVEFLKAPNIDGETWQELWTKVGTDLLIFDAGCIENVFAGTTDSDGHFIPDGELEEMVALRGSSMYPIVDDHGHVLGYKQNANGLDWPVQWGETYNQEGTGVPTFGPDQIIYLRLFPNTASPMGVPLIESVINEIITMLRSSEHTMLAMDADEIPPGILVLTGMAGAAAEAARQDLQRLRGKDHKVRVITNPDPKATGAHWVELRHTAKDVDFVNVVAQVRRTIWRIFGVLPIEMGDSENIPRSVGQVQLDVSTSHLINPILELIEAKVNARMLPNVIGNKEELKMVRFRFDRESKLNPSQQKEKAQSLNTFVMQGLMSRNEARAEIGLPPIIGGDVVTITTGQGTFPLEMIVGDGNALFDGNEDDTPPSPSSPGTPSGPPDSNPDEPPELGEFLDNSGKPQAFNRIKFSELPEKIQKALRTKAKEHNEEVGDDDRKRTTPGTLGNVYDRGVGAFHTNPESVRPSVKTPEQWALARVNSFLYALRNLKFRSGKHDTDLLPKTHPLYSGDKDEKAVGDTDPTNFPKSGDDLKVSLRNSNFDVFDKDYAMDLKENYPEIWKKGGNIKGNDQFKDLTPVVERGGVVENDTEEAAVRLREAWSARHFQDYRLAGVVAQIKWYTVGTLGESKMKELINEQKKKVEASRGLAIEMEHAHGCDCCTSHDTKHERSFITEMRPDHWAPKGMFNKYRTLDLDALHDQINRYSRLVTPFWDEMSADILAGFNARYNFGLSEDDAQALTNLAGQSIDKLFVKWKAATEPVYVEASKIGMMASSKYAGAAIARSYSDYGNLYQQSAMGYLTTTGGLLNDLSITITALISGFTKNTSLERAQGEQVPEEGLYVDLESEDAAKIMSAAIAAEKYRVRNWAGKLVELANAAMAEGILESSTADSEGNIVPAEWYAEWVSAGDNRMCSFCEREGRLGFRPLSQFSTMPGGDTECGANCRCVIVLWTKQEVDDNVAVSLTGYNVEE